MSTQNNKQLTYYMNKITINTNNYSIKPHSYLHKSALEAQENSLVQQTCNID
jgi:hypothetical protein